MIEYQPKVSISDNNVGYNPKMEGYVTFMSDMNELYAIVSKRLKTNEDNIEI